MKIIAKMINKLADEIKQYILIKRMRTLFY